MKHFYRTTAEKSFSAFVSCEVQELSCGTVLTSFMGGLGGLGFLPQQLWCPGYVDVVGEAVGPDPDLTRAKGSPCSGWGALAG